MTYNAQEISQYGGSPVELYLFERGLFSWTYTSGDTVETYLAKDYAPAPIVRGKIEDLAELNKAPLKLTVPRDFPVATQFIAYPPGEVVTLKIFSRHRTDVANETVAVWIGRILSAQWAGGKSHLNCEPISTSLKRTGLRKKFGRQCEHVLYGPDCKVVAADFRVIGPITGISGNVVNVLEAAGQPNDYFNGGFLWWQLPDGRKEARMIVDHTGDAITLATTMYEISIGDSVELYPGCDHTLTQCDTRFANSDNNGGYMFTPEDTPFNGKTLY